MWQAAQLCVFSMRLCDFDLDWKRPRDAGGRGEHRWHRWVALDVVGIGGRGEVGIGGWLWWASVGGGGYRWTWLSSGDVVGIGGWQWVSVASVGGWWWWIFGGYQWTWLASVDVVAVGWVLEEMQLTHLTGTRHKGLAKLAKGGRAGNLKSQKMCIFHFF